MKNFISMIAFVAMLFSACTATEDLNLTPQFESLGAELEAFFQRDDVQTMSEDVLYSQVRVIMEKYGEIEEADIKQFESSMVGRGEVDNCGFGNGESVEIVWHNDEKTEGGYVVSHPGGNISLYFFTMVNGEVQFGELLCFSAGF